MAFEDVGWGGEDNLKNQGLRHHLEFRARRRSSQTDGGSEHGMSWEPWEKIVHVRHGPM